MRQINPTHSFTVENVTTNVYHANRGEGLPMHSHDYDHVTVCMAGVCVVRKGEKTLVIDKTVTPVLLKAPDPHEIEALADGTVFVNTLRASNDYARG